MEQKEKKKKNENIQVNLARLSQYSTEVTSFVSLLSHSLAHNF